MDTIQICIHFKKKNQHRIRERQESFCKVRHIVLYIGSQLGSSPSLCPLFFFFFFLVLLHRRFWDEFDVEVVLISLGDDRNEFGLLSFSLSNERYLLL
jgi:hypothetical protein